MLLSESSVLLSLEFKLELLFFESSFLLLTKIPPITANPNPPKTPVVVEKAAAFSSILIKPVKTFNLSKPKPLIKPSEYSTQYNLLFSPRNKISSKLELSLK